MAAALANLSPAEGQLAADNETARFTHVTADLTVDAGTLPIIWAKVSTNGGASAFFWHLVYDGSAFAPLFAEHSTVEQAGQVYSFDLLPTGGWWDTAVELTWGQFSEAA